MVSEVSGRPGHWHRQCVVWAMVSMASMVSAVPVSRILRAWSGYGVCWPFESSVGGRGGGVCGGVCGAWRPGHLHRQWMVWAMVSMVSAVPASGILSAWTVYAVYVVCSSDQLNRWWVVGVVVSMVSGSLGTGVYGD
jgi:hypothetical protein